MAEFQEQRKSSLYIADEILQDLLTMSVTMKPAMHFFNSFSIFISKPVIWNIKKIVIMYTSVQLISPHMSSMGIFQNYSLCLSVQDVWGLICSVSMVLFLRQKSEFWFPDACFSSLLSFCLPSMSVHFRNMKKFNIYSYCLYILRFFFPWLLLQFKIWNWKLSFS